MRHRERETEVDLHHNIVPRTARLKIDPAPLLAAARPVGGSRLRVLAPHDMVLHSAVHLFHDGDMVNGLRELVDIDDLLRHFGQQAGFWDALVPRATALGVSRPLFYGLHYCRKLLETPIPEDVMAAAASAAPQTIILAVMDRLVPAALLPQHPDLPRRTTAFARWLLFVRSHYLRMPMRLLIPHLTRKAWRRVKGEEAH